jgi:hypothetical protein
VYQPHHQTYAYENQIRCSDVLSDKFKKWKFIVMGTLAGLANFLLSESGARVPGILQLIILQRMSP